MNKFCECGCGKIVKPGNRYINGHNGRGIPRSEKTKQKLSKSAIGKIISKETRQKLSKAHTGKTLSKNHCQRISEANMGHIVSKETRQKIATANTGKIRSEEIRQKMSESRKGLIPWNKGKMASKQAKINMAIAHIKPNSTDYCDVWMDREYIDDLRKSTCEICGVTNNFHLHICGKGLHTHHKNGKLNCSPNDIQTLCSNCHLKLHHKIRRMDQQLKERNNA